MADEWDDFQWWEPYEPGAGGSGGGGGSESPSAPAAPTNPLKSKSWGSSNSQGSTEMPSWYGGWFQNWFNQPSSGGGGGITGTTINGPTQNPNTGGYMGMQPGMVTDSPGSSWAAGAGSSGENFSVGGPGGGYYTGGPGAQGGQGLNWMGDTFQKYFQNGPMFQNELNGLVGTLGDYYTNQYSKIPELIDTQKQNIMNSIYSSVPKFNELYQPILENMSSRGILDSSITSDAISKTNDAVQNDILSKIYDAATWAGGQQIGNVKESPAVISNIMSAIAGAGDRNTQFGQTAMGAAGNMNNAVLNFLELLRNQKSQSQSSQGSETYNV